VTYELYEAGFLNYLTQERKVRPEPLSDEDIRREKPAPEDSENSSFTGVGDPRKLIREIYDSIGLEERDLSDNEIRELGREHAIPFAGGMKYSSSDLRKERMSFQDSD